MTHVPFGIGVSLFVAAQLLFTSNASAQAWVFGDEPISPIPIERPSVSPASSAEVFARACLSLDSPYYSARQFVRLYQIEKEDVQTQLDIGSAQYVTPSTPAAEQFVVRGTPIEEYLQTSRWEDEGKFHEYCILVFPEDSLIDFIFGTIEDLQEIGISAEYSGERSGIVKLRINLERLGRGFIQLGATQINGRQYIWLAKRAEFY